MIQEIAALSVKPRHKPEFEGPDGSKRFPSGQVGECQRLKTEREHAEMSLKHTHFLYIYRVIFLK